MCGAHLEGDVPGDEVVSKDGEGGAAERRRVAAQVAVTHHLIDAGVGVRVEADVRHGRAGSLQQNVAFPRWDGNLLPADHNCCNWTSL